MKKLFFVSVLSSLVILSGFTPAEKKPLAAPLLSSAPANDFAFIRAHRQGNGITLTWGMISGIDLAGFDIEKTMQDPNDPFSVWEPVSSVAATGVRSYKYTDTNILPGTTHYRITAWHTGGGSSLSDVVSVRIVSH